jgi:hypothetical protein
MAPVKEDKKAMDGILKRFAMGVLGVVVTLAIWQFTGYRSSSSIKEIKGIPATVWDGGGGTMVVSVDTTSPARFSISFSDDKDRSIDAWTEVKAGAHSWTVNVPPGAGGYIELGAEGPKVGDTMNWKITLNGETVEEQSETLNEPLKDGYAFFLQSYYDDYSKMEASED